MINLNKRKWILAIAFAAFAAGIFYLGGISLAQSTEKEVVDVAPTDSTQFLAGNGKNSPVVDPLVKKNGIDEPENYVSTNEVEPNETAAAATKLGGSAIRVRGDIYPNADVDFYSFYANAGDRVFAATQTSSGQGGTNSTLDLIGSDGTTIIETDLDDGSFATAASSIAGRTVPSSGLYYLKVTGSTATTQIRYYDLYLQVQGGSPGAEVEPNDSTATATPMNAGRFMSGAISSTTDAADFYSFTANAGDTVFLSLDFDPERDAATWNGRLGLSTFSNFTLVVNDTNAGSPNSEAFMFTIKQAGTYYAYVDPSSPGSGAPTFTYNLSVTVIPAKESKCTTYTTANAAQPIGPDPTSPNAVQTISIPDSKRISKAIVNVNITHAKMADIDLDITSPQGNSMTLFNDVGSATANTANLLDLDVNFDDDAALPIGVFTVVKPMHYQPENFTRMSWLKGENAQGTWTLTARDDTVADAGTLNSWSVTVCEDPALASVPALEQTIYSSNFETDDGGFTHSGTGDEWERGLPTTNVAGAAIIDNCFSGTSCWKTDLDNTYNNAPTAGTNITQDLISPNIDLTGQAGRALKLSWAHKYQVESASFDHYYVEVKEVGGSGLTRRVFEHTDGTMTGIVGSPNITLQGSAGWAVREYDITEFAGKTVTVTFHMDQDNTVPFAGVAVDDVSVVALKTPASADFDADGGTDISVFRTNGEDATDGRWYVLNSSNASVTSQQFGLDTDTPVAGDYDGDGDVDIAVFRASEGRWYISQGSRFNFSVIYFGTAGDIAVPADYDGDGKTDAAVFRAGTWIIRRSSDSAVQFVAFGLVGDNLVPRDYDGDGKADIAVFRNGTWYIQQSFYGTTRIEQFGTTGDTPVVGDYDRDRKADLAVFRAGTWYIRNSATCSTDIVAWGLATDVPVQGDYDRDRRTDIAVYRNGVWYILRSSDNTFIGPNWGIAGDTPIPPR
ncbi:MAG: proprotein convertase P-domain-containing protein [Acidobacteria bacterium]|nr:proprotein convertase P-domain-containing protein [Acidobacteriota bacterium]